MGFSLSHTTTTTTTSDASRSSLLLLQGFLVALFLLIAPTSLPLAMLITGVATTGGYRVSPLSLSKFVFSFIIIYFQFKLFWWLELYDFVWVWKMGVLGMAKCDVIEYLFGVSLCVCCGYSFGLDFWVSNEWWFWVSNERWLDGYLHFTDLGWCQNGFWYESLFYCVNTCHFVRELLSGWNFLLPCFFIVAVAVAFESSIIVAKGVC